MSAAIVILKDFLFFKIRNEPESINLEGMTPEEYIESVCKDFQDTCNEMFQTERDNIDQHLEEAHEELTAYFHKNREPWKEVLKTMKHMYFLHVDVQFMLESKLQEYGQDDLFSEFKHLQTVTVYIYQRLCQLYNDVITLLDNGCVEGAFTLFYSMYELSTSLLFIHSSKQSEKVAKAYIKYSHEDNGSHAWAKADKRLSSSRMTAVPFHRIEALSGIKVFCDAFGDYPYRHLQAFGADEMQETWDVPGLFSGNMAMNLEVSAQLASGIFLFVLERIGHIFIDENLLFRMDGLHRWCELLEDMIQKALEEYDAFLMETEYSAADDADDVTKG